EVDVDQVVGQQLPVHDDAGGDEHVASPAGHVLVAIVHRVRVLEAPPAAQHDAPAPDLLVAGQGVVEDVEHVVVHGHGLFDEVQAAQQTRQLVGEHLRGRDGAHPTGVQRGRVYVPALHEAAHLPGDPAEIGRAHV